MRARCLTFVLLFVATALPAQNIVLKTGQTVETTGVRRTGDTIMGKILVGASTGEVGYPIANIASISFPEPQALESARQLLAQGEGEKALSAIEPIVKYYEPFQGISGSWWAPAALVKVSALAALKRSDEAEPLAKEIKEHAADPDVARGAELRLAEGYIARSQFEKAAQICDAMIHDSTDSTLLADAWTIKGDLFTAQHQWDNALLAYLHVPVFFHDQRLFMPPALLGSARSLRRLDDKTRARARFEELIASFPKSAEASVAQKELQKLPK